MPYKAYKIGTVMIKISKLADYAVVALNTLSHSDEAMLPTSTLAQRSNLPEPTVSKVMKLLNKSGVVSSTRGAGGGYQLARSPAQITVAQIITAIDGPIALTSCVDDGDNSCGLSHSCAVSGRWTSVNNAVKNALADVTLADMTRPPMQTLKGQKHVANR